MSTPVDLTTCDREPIHTPGAIQPHGVLLAFNESGLQVRSANAARLGPLPALGSSLDSAHLTAEVRAAVAAMLADPHHVSESLTAEIEGQTYDVVSHRSDGLVVVELEDRNAESMPWPEGSALASQRAIVRIQGIGDRATMLQALAHEVRSLTGFDRVMVYRFQPDDSGLVEAEERREDLEPFLGQRYPASDIPAQARRLYVLNPVRLIADTAYRAVALEPPLDPGTGRPLDLSHSMLRSVSPIHVEYLTNMGVLASMSISIVLGGKLWGLVACHHMSPRLVSYAARMSCHLMAQVVSIVVDRVETAAGAAALVRALGVEAALVDKLTTLYDALPRLTAGSPSALDLIASDGAVVVLGGEIATVGRTPSAEGVHAIVAWLKSEVERDQFDTAHAAKDCELLVPSLEGLCGLLAVRFSADSDGYVVWFRAEQREQVRWGGDPGKQYTSGPLGSRLTPTGSFQVWLEDVVHQSVAWTESERVAARRLGAELAAVGFAEARARIVALEKSNSELDRLAYVIGHDIRAPLRAIGNLTKFLEEDLAAGHRDEALAHAAHARERVAKLDALIVAMLGYARAGQDRETARVVDVAVLVRDTLTLLDVPDQIRVELQPDLPTLVTHAVRLQQVFINLITNATKYGMIDGSGSIEIGSIDRGSSWEFFVRDEGRGIDERHIDQVFELFTRLATEVAGTGVGLAVVRRIVEAHGGRAWCESPPGKGATFRFLWAKNEPEA